MNFDVVIGLAAMAMGVLLTLAFQAHRKAAKAVKEAKEAVASVDALSDTVRYQVKVINDQTKAHMDVFTSDYDKRIQKLEIRVDDQGSRVAALQIKR
jgi:archaellin